LPNPLKWHSFQVCPSLEQATEAEPTFRMERGRGLIIFPGALGDLMCLLPAIHALNRRYPAIGFELMARAELAGFAERRMPIVAGHSIDRHEVASLFSDTDTESNRANIFFGQFHRIDCFFASDNDRFRLSLRRATRAALFFYPFRPPGIGHIADGYLRAIDAIVPHPLYYPIELVPDDLHRAQERLSRLQFDTRSFVLILPGSGSSKKNWPAENFAALAQRLNHRVLVVLGPAETGMAAIFRARSLPVLSEVGLGELAGIAHLARCFIGNDSGVSHLAAAAGARGLVIFGPTAPERWRPLGDVKVIQQQPLRSLLVEQVRQRVAELIEAKR
jgi:ADP-heptose:LPS heptosyltransferase